MERPSPHRQRFACGLTTLVLLGGFGISDVPLRTTSEINISTGRSMNVGATSDPASYSKPITITTGGTYQGNWESTDPGTAAVTVATAQPVTIQNCVVRSKGNLVRVPPGTHAKVTIRNCSGYGVNPGIAGLSIGRFFIGEEVDQLRIVNNYMESTGGIYVLSYAGKGSGDTIKILRNKSRNIDGRVSTGAGLSATETVYRQFVQLNQAHAVPGAEIAWNEVVNEPYASRVEDNINIYESGGTQADPLTIHDNYIQGAYPAAPESQNYSGGGIITDGGTSDTSWISVYNNQIVATVNHGLGIAAGRDIVMYGNRLVSSGLLQDGRPISAQNVGAFVWNIYSLPQFTDNVIRDNIVGWYRPTQQSRSDYWFPDCNPTDRCSGNSSIKPGRAITLADEAAEYWNWRRKLTAAGVSVGTN